MKRFPEWIDLKEKLHDSQHQPPFVSERDLWWASIGENVGSEINGKSSKFSRPVLILRKLTHGFYLVVPTTTQPHVGSWYIHIRFADQDEWICLHQIRTIDHRRIHSKIGQIDTDDFERTRAGFKKLYF